MALRDQPLFTRLLRTRPLFLAALMLLIGCIAGYAVGSDGTFLLFCAAMLAGLILCAILLLKKQRIASALLVVAMLPLGTLRFAASWNQTAPLPDQTHVTLSGRICEVPEQDLESERCICVLEDISIGGKSTDKKLRLYLRGDEEMRMQVCMGQKVSCEAHIWQADVATNPGQFNFSNYLRLRGLSGYATAEIETARFTQDKFTLSDAPKLLREKLGAYLELLFPENAPLAKAFLLGDRSDLSQEERNNFSRSGVAHLLAISGMHISVLSGAVSLLLGRFMGRRRSFVCTLVLLALYGVLLGFTASLTRAMLFFALFGSGMFVGRCTDGPTRLAAALIIYLLARPEGILDAGFVLSFGASAGIILLYGPLVRLFHAQERLTYRPRGDAASRRSRLVRWGIGMCITSLAAQLAILPAVAHYFGAQPLFSLVTNLLAVPLAMFAYVLSIAESLLAGLLRWATGLAVSAYAGDFLFGLLTDCVAFFAKLPLSTLRIARFPHWLSLIVCIAMLFSADFSRIPERLRRFLPLTVVLAVFVSNLCAYLPSLGFSMVFLDAGQADCAVVRAEGNIYLIDTGDAYSPAADYLSAMNYDVKAVFLSHMHSDHAGGLASVLEVCTPERIYISANWDCYEADAGVQSGLDLARERGSEIITLAAGDALPLSPKTTLQVLSPEAGICAKAANDDSLVLRVEYCGSSAIFTGDASAAQIGAVMTDCDVLKVPHHGASNALSVELLMSATPSAAILSVGYNNYGHPSEKTLDLLRRAEVKTFSTRSCGAIHCRFGENGDIRLRPYLASEALNSNEME